MIYIKSENKSYEYTINKLGNISYDNKTGEEGKSEYLTQLEANLLESQSNTQKNNSTNNTN